MCGLPFFCSTAYHYFDQGIATKWMVDSDGFSKMSCEDLSLKRENSFELEYMFQLVRNVKGGIYSIYRQMNMIQWTYLRYDSKY